MVIGPDFVFLAVPRTGSQTLTYHWLPHYGGETMGIDHYHRMDVPAEHAGKFTFAVVRNPYDRILSLSCLMKKFSDDDLQKINMRLDLTPAEFAEWCTANQTNSPQWKNQTDFLSAARIDMVLRFEDLRNELTRLPFAKRAQWNELPITNSTKRKPINEDLTRQFLDAVNIQSAPDFARYGYTML